MGWEAPVFSLFWKYLRATICQFPPAWRAALTADTHSISLLSTGTVRGGDEGGVVQGLGAELRVAAGVRAFCWSENTPNGFSLPHAPEMTCLLQSTSRDFIYCFLWRRGWWHGCLTDLCRFGDIPRVSWKPLKWAACCRKGAAGGCLSGELTGDENHSLIISCILMGFRWELARKIDK